MERLRKCVFSNANCRENQRKRVKPKKIYYNYRKKNIQELIIFSLKTFFSEPPNSTINRLFFFLVRLLLPQRERERRSHGTLLLPRGERGEREERGFKEKREREGGCFKNRKIMPLQRGLYKVEGLPVKNITQLA